MSDFKLITGLYIGKTKNNQTMMSGKTIDGVKYFVFKNNKKQIDDKLPEYQLFVDTTTQTDGQPTSYKKTESAMNLNKPLEPTADDLPF